LADNGPPHQLFIPQAVHCSVFFSWLLLGVGIDILNLFMALTGWVT